MARPTIDLYIDVISHNAFLAWHEMPALCARNDAHFVTHPVVFGAMLRANGQLGPAEIPAKSAWMIRDVLRKAQRLGIEINPPAAHPFNPLLALRAIVMQRDEAARRAVTSQVLRAVWVDSRDVSTAKVLTDVFDDAGLDGSALVRSAQSDEARAALRASTDAALARGVFGVPSMCVGGEVFWGYDDFPALEARLGGAPPIARSELARWERVRPGVQRRR